MVDMQFAIDGKDVLFITLLLRLTSGLSQKGDKRNFSGVVNRAPSITGVAEISTSFQNLFFIVLLIEANLAGPS